VALPAMVGLDTPGFLVPGDGQSSVKNGCDGRKGSSIGVFYEKKQ
jgi:hypothetical protein